MSPQILAQPVNFVKLSLPPFDCFPGMSPSDSFLDCYLLAPLWKNGRQGGKRVPRAFFSRVYGSLVSAREMPVTVSSEGARANHDEDAR
jgi:hypothetical protein